MAGKKKAAEKTQAITAELAEDEGLDPLRDAVVDELRRNPTKIAQTLREKAEEGDTQSTKLIVEIMQKPKKKKPKEGKSVAMEIASDRTWEFAAEGKSAVLGQADPLTGKM
ncbi:MAG: hypothetical protein P4K83_11070 [Terracidiphilus sp.]|nr:hypothetical protein [Terracidiphilus sp.]